MNLEPVPDQVLDIQHDTDPAQDHSAARRIPHMGHALLFFSLAWFMLNVAALICFAALHIRFEDAASRPGALLAAQALSYVLTLAVSLKLFPRFWGRSFLQGIEWNVLAVRRRWYWLIPTGIALSFAAQFSERFVKTPEDGMIARLMHTPHGAWAVTAFGVLLAPLAEEIAFRGFLLPAIATAYDWLALERSPAGLRRWESSTAHTVPALIFATVFSSLPFALLHAGQLAHAWGAIGVLFVVSLVLSFVRIRNHSVASSTLVHMVHNLTIFVYVFAQTDCYRHLDKLK